MTDMNLTKRLFKVFKRLKQPKLFLPLIGLITAGYLGNYFHLALFFGIDFLFGSIAVFLVIYYYGTLEGTIAALIVSSYTYSLWGHPYALIIFTLEALFVGWKLRRQKQHQNLVRLDLIYWLLIGIPLVILLYGAVMGSPVSGTLVVALKQSVNGILNALIASLIINYLPLSKRLGKRKLDNRLSLQQTILNLLIAFVFFPTLILTVFHGEQVFQNIETEISSDLKLISTPLANSLHFWYEHNLHPIEEIANTAAQLPAIPIATLQQSTELTKGNFADYLKIYVADETGKIIAAAPSINEVQELIIASNINKSLIKKIAANLQPTLSEVHTDKASIFPHVGLAIPVIKNNQFKGIAYGSLDLTELTNLLQKNSYEKGFQITLVDSKNQIIATTKSARKIMEQYLPDRGRELHQIAPGVFQSLPADRSMSTMTRWRNSFYVQTISLGRELPWHLSVEISTAPYMEYMEWIYIKNLAIMLSIATLALIVAVILSNRLLKPLVLLTQLTTNVPEKLGEDNTPVALPESQVKEIDALTTNFQAMLATLHRQFQEIKNTNQTLEARVKERTDRLLELNEELATEIVQREKIEETLQERQERYELAISGTNDGIWDWHIETDRVYYSPTWMRIVGYEDRPLSNNLSSWSDNIHPEDLAKVLQSIQDHLDGKTELYENTHRIKHRDGRYLWIAAKGRCIRDEKGKAYRLVGTITDITDKKLAEEELRSAKEEAEAANRSKSEFLATMSHEIRTPMNAVIGMTGLLLDTKLSKQQREFVEIVRNSGDALLTIINDILDFSKIESGKLEIENQPFNLRTCVEESLDLLATKASEKGIELAYFMTPEMPETILGDVTRLRQILVNLLANAVKFTQTGEVVISVTSRISQEQEQTSIPSCEIQFSVRDTGIGIPASRMDRLFKAFSQVDASVTRNYGGTGLGLVISRKLCEMMGGTMWVESGGNIAGEPPAKWERNIAIAAIDGQPVHGSTFFFTIVSKPIQYSNLNEMPEDSVLKNQRLLIVDDNVTNRQLLTIQAQYFGMIPHAVVSGKEALALLEVSEKFDLAILDMQMPEMDGLTLAHLIRQHPKGKELPLVMLTSIGKIEQHYPDIQSIDWAAYLNKPIKQSQLHKILVKIASKQTSKSTLPSTSNQFDPQMAEKLPLKILLAEDNVVNQKVAINMLQRLGYRADIVANGLEALEAVRRQAYDLVLMDVQMPEMDGLSATHQIHQQWSADNNIIEWKRPWIIAMTANAMAGDREICLEAGMDDYISKPIKVEELIRALDRSQTYVMSYQSDDRPIFSQDELPEEEISHAQEGTILDESALQELKEMAGDDTAAIITELIDYYLEDSPKLLQSIMEAIKQDDANGLQRAAHTLKSSSASLGALKFSQLCKTLEALGRSSKVAEASTCLSELMEAYHQVEFALHLERKKYEE